MSHEIKKGSEVRITNNLEGSKTQQDHILDTSGNMLKMQGKIYKVNDISRNTIKVYYPPMNTTYFFNIDDIELYHKIPELIEPSKPIIFNFNPKDLDI